MIVTVRDKEFNVSVDGHGFFKCKYQDQAETQRHKPETEKEEGSD